MALLWFDCLNGPVFAENIDDLDEHAPNALRKIWQNLNKHHGTSLPVTGTIYHFGWSEKKHSFFMYGTAYESEEAQ